MIPEGWNQYRFGDITRIAEGQVDPRVAPYRAMRHIGPENVSRNTGQLSECPTCEEIQLISGKYLFDEKAVVYSKIRPHLNKVCFPRWVGVCSADMYPIWPIEEFVITEFLLQYMLGPSFLKHAVACSMRTGMPKINRADLVGIPIALPPIEEQRRIAKILSTWDRAIETVEALIANARGQKAALMQTLLTGKRRLPGYGGAWENEGFGDLFDLKIGGTPYRQNSTYWDPHKLTGNLWVTISDLSGKYIRDTREYISDEGVRRSNVKLLPSDTVLMSFKLSIGRRAILRRPAFTNEAICALIPKDAAKVSSVFVYHALELVDFTASVDQAVKGQTLNKAKLAELRLRLPSRDEQDRIAEVLDRADDELHMLIPDPAIAV